MFNMLVKLCLCNLSLLTAEMQVLVNLSDLKSLANFYDLIDIRSMDKDGAMCLIAYVKQLLNSQVTQSKDLKTEINETLDNDDDVMENV